MKENKTIIIFEESIVYIKQFSKELKKHLGGEVDIISASNLKDARSILRKIADDEIWPDMIITDSRLESSDEPDVLDIIFEARKFFDGPILAMSSFDDHNNELLKNGADCKCYKTKAISEAIKILNPEDKKRVKKVLDVNLTEHSLRFLYSCLSGFNDESRKELAKLKVMAKKSRNSKLKEAIRFIEDNWNLGVSLGAPSSDYSKLMTGIREKLLQSL